MRSGRTYEVLVNGEPIGLVGSTLLTLKGRRRNGYIKRFGQGVELRLIREIPRHESEDDVSYNFHLKAAEALDIARKKTYFGTGGLNKISPLLQTMGRSMLESEMGRIGGLIQGRRNAKNRTGVCAPGVVEKAGRKNVESGHIQALGRIQGRKNAKSGRLKHIRTLEESVKGGRIGGRKNVESGRIQALGRIQGQLSVENGRLASYRTSEHQSKAAYSSRHVRWHIKRGIIEPRCSLCHA